MKWVLVLLCVAAALAAPTNPNEQTAVVSARQATDGASAVVAPGGSSDDDEEDDDDDLGIGEIVDDDDDDDDDDESDDEDDDDDDDDFERFFEDILGDDDDDDDDEDDTPAAVAPQPVVAPVAPAAAAVDFTAPGEQPAEGTPFFDEEAVPEEQAANFVDTVDSTVNNQKDKPQGGSSSDDDEDDDEDDIDVSDIDDDEDDEEDDDEEDDVDIGELDVTEDIEARRSRMMDTNSAVPPIYITKYNRFVDNILERVNRVLRKNYDPVNVRLQNNSNNNNNNKKNKNKNSPVRRKGGKVGNKRRPRPRAIIISVGPDGRNMSLVDEPVAASVVALSQQLQQTPPTTLLPATTSSTITSVNGTTVSVTATTKDGLDSRARPQAGNKNKKRRKNNNNNNRNKNTNNRRKVKPKNTPQPKATLYGLSSLKRDGDVSVNMMSSHTTVRSRFLLGPLVLKVEKEFGRGAKKDIRSAVATTTGMSGKINLRVKHGGAATLHSIRVLQPKQVRIESSDDHDKTREFMWRRSGHIAHVVTQKLASATRNMLRPAVAAA